MNSIQIFACDHRKDTQWDLPYIRLGNYQSDAAINIKDDAEIAPYQLLLSEGAQIWWVYKHYKDLGNPDFVGFCHYRRFFSFAINRPILNIPHDEYKKEYCANSLDVLAAMQKMNVDGASIMPFQVTTDEEYSFVDIADQLKFLSKKDRLCIPDSVIDQAFQLLLQNAQAKTTLMLKQVMKSKKTYVCNIFVLRKEMFFEYAKTVFPVFKELYKSIPQHSLSNIHPRFMGYILERFTSLYLTAYNLLGKKIAVIPVLTIDANVHKKWDPNTKGDYKLA